MRATAWLGWAAVVLGTNAASCIWLLPEEPILDESGGGGSDGVGGGGNGVGDGGNGVGGQGGSGGDAGGGPPVCAQICYQDGPPCTTPLSDAFYAPTVTQLSDQVKPSGLTAIGDTVFAAVHYSANIDGGATLPQNRLGQWVVELDPAAQPFVKTVECQIGGGEWILGGIAASDERLYTALSSGGVSGSDIQIGSSIDPTGDACSANLPISDVFTAGGTSNVKPFIVSYDRSQPVVGMAADYEAPSVPDIRGFVDDVASNADGVVAFLTESPSPQPIFGEDFPVGRNNAYWVARYDDGDGGLTAASRWVRFEDEEVYQGLEARPGAVAVDEAGNVWVIGTRVDGNVPIAFVHYHRAIDGAPALTWEAGNGTVGRTITVRDGHVIVGLDITETLLLPGGATITPTNRDLAILHFDAASFTGGSLPAPTWWYPSGEAVHPTEQDESIVDIVIAGPTGCDEGVLALMCVGELCLTDTNVRPFLVRLTLSDGSYEWRRELVPAAGTLLPTNLAATTESIWVGTKLTGTAFAHESPGDPPRPTALFLELPH